MEHEKHFRACLSERPVVARPVFSMQRQQTFFGIGCFVRRNDIASPLLLFIVATTSAMTIVVALVMVKIQILMCAILPNVNRNDRASGTVCI